MMGRRAYPQAEALLITEDAGGSNGYRSRAWKQELQRLADDLRVRIHVSHFPPGTRRHRPSLAALAGLARCKPSMVRAVECV